MNLIETQGIIKFDPQKQDSFAPWWAMVELDCDTCSYYQWFLKNRFNLTLQKPMWGPHVSFIRGEECDVDKWGYVKALWNNMPITFTYNIDIRTNGRHWWLNVQSEQLKDIREELGLPRSSFFGLHLTIGGPNERHKDHSDYIHRVCVNYNL